MAQTTRHSSGRTWLKLLAVALGALLVFIVIALRSLLRGRSEAAKPPVATPQQQVRSRRRGTTHVTAPKKPATTRSAPRPEPSTTTDDPPIPPPVPAPSAAGPTTALPPAPTVPEPTAAVDAPLIPPPAPAAPAPPPEPVEERPPEPSVEFCRVTLWRGYRKSRFYAVLAAAQNEVAVAESELFRFRGNGELERTEAIEVAHHMMVETLLSQRWEIDGEADPWYATRLRRPVSGDAEAPVPNPVS